MEPINNQPQQPAPPAVPPTTPITAQPAATPPPAAPPANPPPAKTVNFGLVILQWLTYAFWGWTVLALSVLTTLVIATFLHDDITSTFTPYGLAAILVLLPIAFVCDSLYLRKEQHHKHGAEVPVVAIHAVLFALFGVGALIVFAISIVQLLTSSVDSKSVIVALSSSLIVAIYYALTFLRTLNPEKISWFAKTYRFIMLVTIGIIAILGIIGPVAKERQRRDDKLIDAGLSDVATAVNSYSTENKKLPASLTAVTLDGNAKKLVDKHLVEFMPGVLTTDPYTVDDTSYEPYSASISTIKTTPVYTYQLCVTYKESSEGYSPDENVDSTYIPSTPSTYDHPKGHYCYKLRTKDY